MLEFSLAFHKNSLDTQLFQFVLCYLLAGNTPFSILLSFASFKCIPLPYEGFSDSKVEDRRTALEPGRVTSSQSYCRERLLSR